MRTGPRPCRRAERTKALTDPTLSEAVAAPRITAGVALFLCLGPSVLVISHAGVE